MEYKLKLTNISLSEHERDLIDTRMSLGLTRFANLISKFEINLARKPKTENNLPIVCSVKVNLQAGHEIEVYDSANSADAALSQSVQRTKRAIERHLRHHRGPRLGSSMTSRT
ncbi:HPF/RaiA family ribosome-associated protein [Glaciecola sp. SC05]|uniref:HPF/RaiA family ribosome-associated protein n=1 Tax=Glaciecola sp. SC05 TaxID=1987355 RepID=UPI0035298EBD